MHAVLLAVSQRPLRELPRRLQAALALTGLVAPESRAPRPRRPDPAGQALVAVLLATVATAIIQAPGWGWLAPRTAVLAALAAVTLAALLRAEARRADPLIHLALFRRASFTGACLMGTCGIAALAGAGFLSSLYLQDARSMSALHAALALWPMPAAMAAFAPLAGVVIARHGFRIPAVAAGIALAASSVALTRLTGPRARHSPSRSPTPCSARAWACSARPLPTASCPGCPTSRRGWPRA